MKEFDESTEMAGKVDVVEKACDFDRATERGVFWFFRSGFTLAEIILVMFIVIFLSAAAMTGMIRSQQSFLFNGADQQVQNMMREARSLAVTGKAQPDYTDYDGDGCKDAGKHDRPQCPASLTDAEDDFVTPANYGIYFNKTENSLTMFADIHQSGTSGQIDGAFDAPSSTAIGAYEPDKDVVLAVYVLPSSLELILAPDDGADGYTIFYSPIFADVTFDDKGTANLPNPFFKFGIKEINGTRARCMVIHPVSGVAEMLDKADPSGTILTCP